MMTITERKRTEGPLFSRCILLVLALCASAGQGQAAEPTLVHVNTFPTARALPFFVARDQGFFARHGLKVDLQFTKGSKAQREALAVGGGDSGTNEFYVQNAIKDFADIRGHAIVVDATNTAYALQAKKILLQHGLKSGTDYTLNPVGNGSRRLKALFEDTNNAGAILNLPFSLQAAAHGLHSLGRTTDMLGPYQAGGAFVRRGWAREHAQMLEQYLAAYIEALRWSLDPANRAADAAILVQNYKLPPDIAARCVTLMAEPGFGFARDAKFDLEGFKNVLALRAEVEGGKPADPQRYIDLSYYDQALKLLKQSFPVHPGC